VCAAFTLIESENQGFSEMRGEKKPCASFVLEIVAVIFPHRVRKKQIQWIELLNKN